MRPQHLALFLLIFSLAIMAGSLIGDNKVSSYFQGAELADLSLSKTDIAVSILRQETTTMLQLLDIYNKATVGDKDTAKQALIEELKKRQQTLLNLLKLDPAKVVANRLLQEIVATFPSEAQEYAERNVTVKGTFVRDLWENFASGRTTEEYQLAGTDQKWFDLYLINGSIPTTQSGRQVSVAGLQVGANLVADISSGSFSQLETNITLPLDVTGTRKLAIVFIHFRDHPFPNADKQAITNFVLPVSGGLNDSVNGFYKTSSHNQLSFTNIPSGLRPPAVADIFGPVTIPVNYPTNISQGCQAASPTPGMKNFQYWEKQAMIVYDRDWTPPLEQVIWPDYDAVVFYVPFIPSPLCVGDISNNAATNPLGLKDTTFMDGLDTFNFTPPPLPPNPVSIALQTLVHELGHDLSDDIMQHAAGLDCVSSATGQPVQFESLVFCNPAPGFVAPGSPPAPNTYSDPFDVMGQNPPLSTIVQDLGAYHKFMLGWLTSVPNALQNVTQGGVYTLTSSDQAGNTTYALVIGTKHNAGGALTEGLWVEYRKNLNGVLVRIAPALYQGLGGTSDQGLLDMVPTTIGNFSDAFLGVEGVFLDPISGVQIKAIALRPASGFADVRIDFLKPQIKVVPQRQAALQPGQPPPPPTTQVSLTITESGNLLDGDDLKLFVDGQEQDVGLVYNLGQTTYPVSLDTTNLSNGPHTLVAEAVIDPPPPGIGSSQQPPPNPTVDSDPLTITVDNRPRAVITAPAADSVLSGSFTITAQTSGPFTALRFTENGNYISTYLPYNSTSNIYSITRDTHTSSTGLHQLGAALLATTTPPIVAVVATSSPITVLYQDPGVKITTPTTGSVLSGIATLTATTTGPFAFLRFLQDGTAYWPDLPSHSSGPGGVVNPFYTTTFDTTLFFNGNHTLTAQLLDDSLLSLATSIPVSVNYDNGLTTTFTLPPAGITLSGIFNSFTVRTTGVFSYLRFVEDGTNIFSTNLPYKAPPASPYYVASRDTRLAANGSHNLTAQLLAADGTTVLLTSSPLNVIYNNPTVAITAPANTTPPTIVSGNVTLTAETSGTFGFVQFTEDGVNIVGAELAYHATPTSYLYTLNTVSRSNGNHTIGAKLLNASRELLKTSSPVTVTYSNGLAVAITAPANNASVSGIITLTAQTIGTFTYLRFLPDGSQAGAPGVLSYHSSSNIYTTEWDTTPWAGVAPHTFVVQLLGTNGTTVLASSTVSVTSNNPSATLTAPTANQTLSGNTTFTAQTTGVFNALHFVQSDINNTVVSAELPYHATPLTYSLPWNTTSQSNGAHTITAELSNASGAWFFSTAPVTVNYNNAATVNIVAPVNNSRIWSNWTLTTNTTGSFASIRYKQDTGIGSGLILGSQNYTGAPQYNFVWNTSAFSDGKHILKAELLNAAGTVLATSNEVTVSYDNGATVAVIAPAAGTTLNGPWTFTANATGRFKQIFFLEDNIDDTSGNYTLPSIRMSWAGLNINYNEVWNTEIGDSGNHNISARITDDYDQVIKPSNSVSVDYENHITLIPTSSPQTWNDSTPSVTLIANATDHGGIGLWKVGIKSVAPATCNRSSECDANGAISKSCFIICTGAQLPFNYSVPIGEMWAYDNTPSHHKTTVPVYHNDGIIMPINPPTEPEQGSLAPSPTPLPLPSVEPEATPLSIPDSDQAAAVIQGFWRWLGRFMVK